MAFSLFGNEDVLEQKKRELDACTYQYDSAVSLVTSTVQSLKVLGEDIDNKIREIEEYNSRLMETREEYIKMKAKNDKVAANFSALLGE